jgi:nucleotide-binding universal stress UspA family protein
MKIEKYKILVLSDLNKYTSKTIKSSVSLAKIVEADINFFYVKKPTEVVVKESQLSAMRTINRECVSIDKKIKSIIGPLSEKYKVTINYAFTFGNLKNEIEKHIDENKPDIIVLGKRKSKKLNFISDNITSFILKKHKGPIVIIDNKNELEPNKELSLGFFNHSKTDDSFSENIMRSTQIPLKAFNIRNNLDSLKSETLLKESETVEYVFSEGDNVLKNISNYLLKSNVNLLFVNRQEKNPNLIRQNIKDVINKLNCSLILTT